MKKFVIRIYVRKYQFKTVYDKSRIGEKQDPTSFLPPYMRQEDKEVESINDHYCEAKDIDILFSGILPRIENSVGKMDIKGTQLSEASFVKAIEIFEHDGSDWNQIAYWCV